MTLKAICDRVIVQPSTQSAFTSNILFGPSGFLGLQSAVRVGKVIAVGPGARRRDGSRVDPDFKVGDVVIFRDSTGVEVEHNGIEYLVLPAAQILGVLEPSLDSSWMAVEVHLPDADPDSESASLKRIQQAVGDLLESFGCVPEPESMTVTFASWHWKEWFRMKEPLILREGGEFYDGIKEALRRQKIDAAGAESFEKRATAAAALLASLAQYEQAVVRLGDVIIVKAVVDGVPRIAIETVSMTLARELESQPQLACDPMALFKRLQDINNIPSANIVSPNAERIAP